MRSSKGRDYSHPHTAGKSNRVDKPKERSKGREEGADPRPHPGRGLGKFPAVKAERMVHYFNEAERDFLFLLDYERSVLRYRDRPFSFELQVADRWVRYMPDFSVDVAASIRAYGCPGSEATQPATSTMSEIAPTAAATSDGWEYVPEPEHGGERHLIVEVILSRLANTAAAQDLFACLKAWCAERTYGQKFCWVTEADMRGCYLENVKLLTRFARHTVDPAVRGKVQGILHGAPYGMALGKLAEMLKPLPPDDAIASILHLAYGHEVSIQLGEWAVSGESLVCLPYYLQPAQGMAAPHPLERLFAETQVDTKRTEV